MRASSSDMDPQFQVLAREISEAVAERLRGEFGESEARVKKHIDEFEKRAETRMQMHFENLEEKVEMAAEGYDATLKGIERRLTEINTDFGTKFHDQDLVLTDHSKRIVKLEESR